MGRAVDFQLHLSTETVNQAETVQPLLVAPEETVADILTKMKSNNADSVLICRDDVLIGIFTERDVLKLMAAGEDLKVPVEDVMVSPPVTVAETDTVGWAIEMMSGGGYRRLPIIDELGRPTGLLKASGILHYLVQHFPNTIYTLPPEPDHTTQTREGA